MRISLVSDAHVRGFHDIHQNDLVELLRRWPTDAWVFAGDIFDVWWGFPHTVFSAGIPLLAAIGDLRRQGVSITWIRGNHDFDLGSTLTDELGVEVVDRWTYGSKLRFLAVHGDQADPSLRQRALGYVARHRWTASALRLAGPDRSWRWLTAASHASRATQPPTVDRVLADQRAWVDRVLGDTADVVFTGHSHAPGIEERPHGTWVNLGDWLHHRTFATIDDEDFALWAWGGTVQLPVVGRPRRRPELVQSPP